MSLAPVSLGDPHVAAHNAERAAFNMTLMGTSVKSAPYNAVGDGVADDTAAFTALIASGNKNLYVPPGTYIVNGLALNQAGQSLTLAPGVILRAKAGGTQTMITITADNVTINALGATFDGNSVGNNAGSTLWLNNGKDFRLTGGSFINYLGIGLNIEGDRATVTRCTLTNSAGNNSSIFVAGPTTTADLLAPEISYNKIIITATGAGANGIYVTNNTGRVVRRAKVIANEVSIPASSTAGIGITLFGGCVNSVVSGNTCEGGYMGISIDKGSGTVCNSNTIHGPATNGIEFAGPANSTCTGNTIDGNGVTVTGVSLANVTGGSNVVTANNIYNLSALGSGTNGTGIFAQNAAGTLITMSGNNITAFVPIYCKQSGHTIVGNNLTGANSAVSAVAFDSVTDSQVSHNTCSGFSLAAVNVFSGTMNGLLIGPNVLTGGTPAGLVNGWTPGVNGVGSRYIIGNGPSESAPLGFATLAPRPSGGDDRAMLQALCDAATAANGGIVLLQPGVYQVSSTLFVQNKVTLRGAGRDTTQIKAMTGFATSTPVIALENSSGTGLTFASRIERLAVDANNIVNSIGVRSNAGNEQCGVFDAVVSNFRLYGIQYMYQNSGQNPSGPQIDTVEVYPSTSGATYGIYFNNVALQNTVRNVTVGSNQANILTAGIYVTASSVQIEGAHFEGCTNGIYLAATSVVSIDTVTGHATTPTLVHFSANTQHCSVQNATATGSTNIIVDDFNVVTIPATVNSQQTVPFYSGGHVILGGVQLQAAGSGQAIFTNTLRGYDTLGKISFAARGNTDANDRVAVYTDGSIAFGSGSAAVDTVLYRDAALRLRVSQGFMIDGGVGFYGKAPVSQGAALTAATAAAPAGGTGTAAGAWDTAAHRDTAIAAINNLQTRVAQLEARLNTTSGVGIIAG